MGFSLIRLTSQMSKGRYCANGRQLQRSGHLIQEPFHRGLHPIGRFVRSGGDFRLHAFDEFGSHIRQLVNRRRQASDLGNLDRVAHRVRGRRGRLSANRHRGLNLGDRRLLDAVNICHDSLPKPLWLVRVHTFADRENVALLESASLRLVVALFGDILGLFMPLMGLIRLDPTIPETASLHTFHRPIRKKI